MIIKEIALFIVNILDSAAFYEIPKLPDELFDYFDTFLSLMTDAINLLSIYVPLEFVFTLVSISVILDLAIGFYELILWVLNKIPCIDID